MSESALVNGVVNRLRSAFGDTQGRFVFPADDLRPPPGTNSFQTAPYCVTVGKASSTRGPTQSGDVNDQVYTLQVCVTRWLGFKPQDRQAFDIFGSAPDVTNPATADPPTLFAQGTTTALAESGLADVADQVVAYLEEDWDAVAAMNALIGGYGVTTNGFIEPFHQHSKGTAESQGGKWVGSDDKADGEIKTVTITLSGARRIRVRGTL